MGVRAEFEVRKLPDSYVTFRTEYAFENDGDLKDRNGNIRKKMIPKQIEERGGWLIIVRGKPGHSLRFTSLDQLEAFKLINAGATEVRPRLINTETGEECDERGIPLSVVQVMGAAEGGERVETDVDVTRNDSQMEIDTGDPAEKAVGASITALE